MSQCPKTTKNGEVRCHGGEGHQGPCFLGGVLLADFEPPPDVEMALCRAHADLRAVEAIAGIARMPTTTKYTREETLAWSRRGPRPPSVLAWADALRADALRWDSSRHGNEPKPRPRATSRDEEPIPGLRFACACKPRELRDEGGIRCANCDRKLVPDF